MRVKFMIENPDSIEATIKITMTVKEWTELRDQLENNWPTSGLSRTITDVMIQARKVFYAEGGD